MDLAALLARLAAYLGASLFFGVPLFHLYGLRTPTARRTPLPDRALLRASVALLAVGAFVSVATQSAAMMGQAAAMFQPSMWWIVLTGTHYGHGLLARLELIVAAVVLMLRARGSLEPLMVVGAVILVTFAWTGHGGDGEGGMARIHMLADVLHLLAAGAWLGALTVLAQLAMRCARDPDPATIAQLDRGLTRFSGMGPAVVAVLVATGAVNVWVLAGPEKILSLGTNAWGVTLLVKLALFVAMLALAAANRWRLAPRLAGGGPEAARALRLSVLTETGLGVLVLVVVSWLGTLPPPSAL